MRPRFFFHRVFSSCPFISSRPSSRLLSDSSPLASTNKNRSKEIANDLAHDPAPLLDPAGDSSGNIDNFPPDDSPEWGFDQLQELEEQPGNPGNEAPVPIQTGPGYFHAGQAMYPGVITAGNGNHLGPGQAHHPQQGSLHYLLGANAVLREYHAAYVAANPFGGYPIVAPQLPVVFAPQQAPFAPPQEPFAPHQHPFVQQQAPFAPQQDPVIAAPQGIESASAGSRRVLPEIRPDGNGMIKCTVCKEEKFHEEFRGEGRRLVLRNYAAQCNKCAVKKREASRKLAAKKRAERERRRDGGDGGGAAGGPAFAGV